MDREERVKLLFGPYRAPALKRGDRAFCLYRDCAVIIRGWSAAPLPWPRCHVPGSHGAGWGLLVDEELARAIRHESAAAIGHWWGAGRSTVQRWRAAFGVGRRDNEGTSRLIRGAIQVNLDARHRGGRVWAAGELALLGAVTDAEAARRMGRSVNAVSLKRRSLGRPAVTTRSQGGIPG